MERSIVWDCPNCSQRNYTLSDETIPNCWQCRREYGWKSGDFIAAVSHEETLDDDGRFSADTWIPDIDDPDYDKYPDESELAFRDQDFVYHRNDDDWSPAPPDGCIALSDAELAAAERLDRIFRTCDHCGQLSEDCQCFAGSEE